MVSGDFSASYRHVMLDEVDSTNDEVRRRSQSGDAADCFVVSARQQSRGRGRRGRQWLSPAGNVHMSLLVHVPNQMPQAAQLGFVAAVALVDCLRSLVPKASILCKWPNDILLNGRKCAGMLLEALVPDQLILGIGVDVVALPPHAELLYPVTCLQEHGYQGDAATVIALFMEYFQPLLAEWRQSGFAAVRQPWLERARGIGDPVVVRLEQETLCGTFLGLDADGALLLAQPGEKVRPVHAGDVFFPTV